MFNFIEISSLINELGILLILYLSGLFKKLKNLFMTHEHDTPFINMHFWAAG